MKPISGNTKVCGVIGDPIEHTMSPIMHNAAFAQLGLDYVYLPFRVRPEALATAIKGMKALGIRGLNVTIPHKVAVIPFMDEVDPVGGKIGAINTIVNEDGVLRGYNTDATGFLQSLRQRGIDPGGKRVVVLGAGGAARAICFILAETGAELTILNRRQEFDWAVELARSISQEFTKEISALELNRKNLSRAITGADILVNATSVGMHHDVEATPVPADLLPPRITVFDAIYNPRQTRLLREAEQAGAETISGLDMLVWQGALAFEKWTGVEAPVAVMKQAAIKTLEGHED